MKRYSLSPAQTPPETSYDDDRTKTRSLHQALCDLHQNRLWFNKYISAVARTYAWHLINPMELIVAADTRTPPRINRTRELYVAFELMARVPQLLNSTHTSSNRKITTLHLCEAPGSFVDAMALCVGPANLDWHATTQYIPNASVAFLPHLATARQPNGHPRVTYGEDHTGNLLNYANAQNVIREMGVKKAHLVTADGGEPCPAYGQIKVDQLEQHYLPLLCAESFVTLKTLAHGGSYVMRVFDMFMEQTHVLLAFLAHCFDVVEIVCPQTMHVAEPIHYIVARNFNSQARLLPSIMAQLSQHAFHMETRQQLQWMGGLVCASRFAFSQQIWAITIDIVTERMIKLSDMLDLGVWLQHTGICTEAAVAEHRRVKYECNAVILEAPRLLCEEILPY